MIYCDKKIELLAPAKNKECAFAAINAGADAVYIGANAFGARKKASNSLSDITEIIEFAHKFLVKVYVTINTILYENELKDVENLIWKLYEIGVDAIIFQDFALFEMNLPPIALHASTQCNNDSLEKIRFSKSLNIQRVVLPREFSLPEIKEVIKLVDIETEVFIHGALCVSYSGQCYLSNYIGGRSANRGECAQPCRRKYTLIDQDNNIVIEKGYLLSMKDNNLSGFIQALIDAGVTSLKIEGRLKDAEYVTNAVSFYRKLIDSYYSRTDTSPSILFSNFEPDINKTFNRGYTNFYIDGNRKIFINSKSPKFIGEKIGRVISVNGRFLTVDTKLNLSAGDKITYFDHKNELCGTTVKTAKNKIIELLGNVSVPVYTVLYRNYDSEFYKSLSSAEFIRKIPIRIYADNEKIVIKSFNDNEVVLIYEEKFETANNIKKAKDNLLKQLSKLGDTEFIVSEFLVDESFNLFIPVSKLNEIRRKAISQLIDKSKENYIFQRRDTKIKHIPYPLKKLDYSQNISNSLAKQFYEKCGSCVNEFAPEVCKTDKQIILMKTKHCLRHFAGICSREKRYHKQLFLLDEYGMRYPLSFDCKNCVMNILKPM